MERSSKLSRGFAMAMLLVFLVHMEVTWSALVGAPSLACEDHNYNEPQTSVPPYQLELSGDAVVGGETISIVLSSDSGELFTGFLIQARDVETDEIIGTFQTDEWKYVDCDPGVENAVTHPDSSDKTSITADWVAPADYDGVVVLRATVVQQFHTFWVGIESSEVTVTAARSLVDSRTPKTLEQPYEGCMVTKGCFGIPEDCVDSLNCTVAITYVKAAEGYYDIEIFGPTDPSSSDIYVAGGFSFDQEMEETSVMACRSFEGAVDVVMAFNPIVSGGHASDILPIPQMGLSDISASQVDGRLYCAFTREARLVVGGLTYDLDNDMFYLMVARSNLTDTGTLTNHHHENRGLTDTAVSLSDFS